MPYARTDRLDLDARTPRLADVKPTIAYGDDDPIVLFQRSSRMSRCSMRRWQTETAMSGSAAPRDLATLAVYASAYDRGDGRADPRRRSAPHDPVLARRNAATGFYVEAVAAAAEQRLALCRCPARYAADGTHLADYVKRAATPEGFARYLDEFVHARRAA